MKLFRATVLSTYLLLLSCSGQHGDDCPPKNNLILRFCYAIDGNTDVFRKRIDRVDLFLFDEAGRFVLRKTMGVNQQLDNHGIELSLSPGIYRVVCWGNLRDQTGVSPLHKMSRLQDAYICNTTLLSSKATTGDPWYYAPRDTASCCVTIPPVGTATQIVSFTSAHIRLQLFVKGFLDTDSSGISRPPLIEIEPLETRLDFNKKRFGSVVNYSQIAEYQTVDGEYLATADFNLPPFKNENPLKIKIKRVSDGATVTTIPLQTYMEENQLTVENQEEPLIPIYITYGNRQKLAVSIHLPGWSESSVKPGL